MECQFLKFSAPKHPRDVLGEMERVISGERKKTLQQMQNGAVQTQLIWFNCILSYYSSMHIGSSWFPSSNCDFLCVLNTLNYYWKLGVTKSREYPRVYPWVSITPSFYPTVGNSWILLFRQSFPRHPTTPNTLGPIRVSAAICNRIWLFPTILNNWE